MTSAEFSSLLQEISTKTPYAEIAKRYGIAPSTVAYHARKAGLGRANRRYIGKTTYKKRQLRHARDMAIRQEYKTGASYPLLSEKYGLAVATIKAIIYRP